MLQGAGADGGNSTLYGIERALFGIRWADANGEEGEREREAIKSAQIRYSTTLIGRDWRPTLLSALSHSAAIATASRIG